MARQYPQENVFPLTRNQVPIKLLTENSGGPAHFTTQLRDCEEFAEAIEKLVVTPSQISRLPVYHRLRTVILARNHRKTASRRLQNHFGRSFPPRRKQKDICLTILLTEARHIQPAREGDVGEPLFAHFSLKFRSHHSIPYDDKLNRRELRSRAQQQLRALERAQ